MAINIYKNKNKFRPILAFCLIVISLLILFLPSTELNLQPIEGFFSLEVEKEFEDEFSTYLSDNNIKYYAPNNHLIEISNYDDKEPFFVSELEEKLDIRDIRFDPLMHSLINFFYNSDNKKTTTRFFIKSSQNSLFTFLKIYKIIPSHIECKFLMINIFNYLFILFVFIFLIGFIHLYYKDFKFLLYLELPLFFSILIS